MATHLRAPILCALRSRWRCTLHRKCFQFRFLSSYSIQRNREQLGLKWETVLPRSQRTQETCEIEKHFPLNRRDVPEIERLTKRGKWDEARKVFDSIRDKNTIAYNVMMTGARRCGRYIEGIKLFEEMNAQGFPRTEPTYVSAMSLYGGASRPAEGLDLYTEMQAANVAANAPPFVAAMSLCAQLGDYKRACEIWEAMRGLKIEPTSAAFTAVMNAAAAAGDLAATRKRFDEMKAYNMEPNSAQFGCLLKACRTLRDASTAKGILSDMELWSGQRSIVHITIVLGIYRITGLGVTDSDAALKQIEELVAMMRGFQIAPDKFFLEEHIAAILGGELKDVVGGSLSPSSGGVQAALALLDDANLSGTSKTSLLRQVEAVLRRQSSAGGNVSKGKDSKNMSLPVGWSSAIDPKSGRHYYWSNADPAGTTTWQCPSR
eukprot:TRINITY_DN66959_c0_g1_i1.p1 TRINITY_DN66959_c0_g1~~TRINITY_DN66959_c0_g1_i1.p1  ORF type:complete len:433 (-),score=79.30 TRINITY_DN66959_c0_g1_i1:312-1610(-)